MYVIFDSTTQTLLGPFNDYESAQMYMLYASDSMLDGGQYLSIEPVTDPSEWALDNNLTMGVDV